MDARIRFINQVYKPYQDLVKSLASHPLALDSHSNSILHQTEGLVLHFVHFAEKHAGKGQVSPYMWDVGNSIKHIRKKGNTTIALEFAILYEDKSGCFRFIRNSVVGTDVACGKTTDVIQEICAEMNRFCISQSYQLPSLAVPESVYGFWDWAFAYNDPQLAISTEGVRIHYLRRIGGEYKLTNPDEGKFLVLDKNLIGIDPSKYFLESN